MVEKNEFRWIQISKIRIANDRKFRIKIELKSNKIRMVVYTRAFSSVHDFFMILLFKSAQ